MASIRKEMMLAAHPDAVWAAVRDVGAIHTRLAKGFVADVKMDGDARIVTFASGMVLREWIVDVDDAARRLVWAAVEGRLTHHNGSIQVFPDSDACRLVWQADFLPNELKSPIDALMQQGMDAMKQTLEAA
jgi:Polyketide cyclase / dehydrase and lipid transport